jgi:hypothetical protein
MTKLAEHILDSKASHFDPGEFKDRYEGSWKCSVESRPACPRSERPVHTRLNDTTEKNMAPKDETRLERKARYQRIGMASAKTIKNMLAGTALGDKLRAKGHTWVPEKKEPSKKGG